MRYLLTVVLLLSSVAFAKDRAWQTGKLVQLNVQMGKEPSQAVAGGSVILSNDTYTVVVDDGRQLLTASATQSKTWGYKKPLLTENTEVRFSVEKDKLIILDERGKELKTEVLMRKAKN